MEWTKEKPTEPGFYWLRWPDKPAEPVWVYGSLDLLWLEELGSGDRIALPSIIGEPLWYGPMTAPPLVEAEGATPETKITGTPPP